MAERRGRGAWRPAALAQLRSDAAVEVFRHAAGCDRTAVDGLPPVTVHRPGRPERTAHRDRHRRDRRDRLPGQRRHREADGRRRRHHPRRPRRRTVKSSISAAPAACSALRNGGRWPNATAGCAWPGCPHPPSYTEAHHIRWWNAHGGDHRPGQRDPVLQQPPPPRPRRRLADQRARTGAVLHPARPRRPAPTSPSRRPHTTPRRRLMNPTPQTPPDASTTHAPPHGHHGSSSTISSSTTSS